jgi:hypothetical protein
MKGSIVHMVIGLIVIVALSYYWNRGEGFSVPRVVPFELEALAKTKEPFASSPASASAAPAFPASALAAPALATGEKPIVEISDTAYNAMTLKQRSDLLRDVQRLVRDEIRMARQLNPLNEQGQQQEQSNHSEWQGRDYYRRRQKEQQEDQGQQGQQQEQEYRCPKNPDGSCPPVPDMTQYIRKDQIPCWGCSVDY